MAKFDIDDDVKVTMGVEVSIGEYAPRGTVSITENGEHVVAGYAKADVNVEQEPQPLQSKTATPTESQQSIEPDSGYYGLSLVNINPIPSQYIVPSGTSSITSNGIYDITNYASANVNVLPPEHTISLSVGVYDEGVVTESRAYIEHNGTKYSSNGDVITFHEGDSIIIYAQGNNGASLMLECDILEEVFSSNPISYTYDVPAIDFCIYISIEYDKTFIDLADFEGFYIWKDGNGVTPTKMYQKISPSSGYFGQGNVFIDPIPSQYIVPSGTKSITENGTGIDVTEYAAVDVAVPGGSSTLITKTVTENGTYNASSDNADGYSSVTVNVSSGGGGSVDSGVIFIDYDGTIVDYYSASEVASLTALPANPTHNGLTSQGWNWSLADIKTFFVNHPNEKLTVGQMYVTSDGKTRIEIELTEGRLSPYLSLAVNGNVSIDWGDGSTGVMTGSSLTVRLSQQHVYQSAGQYVITIEVTNGTAAFYSTSTYPLLNKNIAGGAANENRVYTNAVKNIYVGSNINIGAYAFIYCNSLTSIAIPDGVTSIGNSAFSSCSSLVSITIPDGVTSISGSTFSNCYSLTSIAIPDGVTSIGSGTFSNCYSLTSITIPDGVTSIESSMFASCNSLTSIAIPDGVTSIGNSAFSSCSSLASITIPDGVTSIGTYVFTFCNSLTSITIPDGVTSIGNNAFTSCSSLASITIPDGVTSIGGSAFNNCYSLASIAIPDGVTSIGTYAFTSCYSLTSITIPDGVTSIGNNAFSTCVGVAEYHFQSETPPTLGTMAFASIPSDCIIYVPSASVETYKAAENWSTYASQIQGE